MMNEIFEFEVQDLKSKFSRCFLCFWLPSSLIPITLPQVVFEQFKTSAQSHNFPYIISKINQDPVDILREIIQIFFNEIEKKQI